jgi:hypothetical protein
MSNFAIAGTGTDTDSHQSGLLNTDEYRMHRWAIGHHHRNAITTAMTAGK